jgi:hypothetical protein
MIFRLLQKCLGLFLLNVCFVGSTALAWNNNDSSIFNYVNNAGEVSVDNGVTAGLKKVSNRYELKDVFDFGC